MKRNDTAPNPGNASHTSLILDRSVRYFVHMGRQEVPPDVRQGKAITNSYKLGAYQAMDRETERITYWDGALKWYEERYRNIGLNIL